MKLFNKVHIIGVLHLQTEQNKNIYKQKRRMV
jgi:hypothetical protein